MLYGVSAVAFRGTCVRHCAFLITAVSMAEALGKGVALCDKVYPTKEGWHSHSTVTTPDDGVSDPSTELEIEVR